MYWTGLHPDYDSWKRKCMLTKVALSDVKIAIDRGLPGLDGDSGPNRPPVPFQIGHLFRSKSATDSGANRPGIPMQIGHPCEGQSDAG